MQSCGRGIDPSPVLTVAPVGQDGRTEGTPRADGGVALSPGPN
jgi:hypothetical protein